MIVGLRKKYQNRDLPWLGGEGFKNTAFMGPGMCGAAPDRFAPGSCFPAVSCTGQVPGTQAQHRLSPLLH